MTYQPEPTHFYEFHYQDSRSRKWLIHRILSDDDFDGKMTRKKVNKEFADFRRAMNSIGVKTRCWESRKFSARMRKNP